MYLGHCQFTSKKGPLLVGLHTPITALERMLELCAQHIISRVQHTEKSLSQHLGTVNQSYEPKLALTSNSDEDFSGVLACAEMRA